jgi:hypothetical protein
MHKIFGSGSVINTDCQHWWFTIFIKLLGWRQGSLDGFELLINGLHFLTSNFMFHVFDGARNLCCHLSYGPTNQMGQLVGVGDQVGLCRGQMQVGVQQEEQLAQQELHLVHQPVD